MTGHMKTGSELDWHNLAAEKQTLVFYMGLNQAATIQAKLLEHGMELICRLRWWKTVRPSSNA